MGFESNGMILAVGGGDDALSLFEIQNESMVGKKVK
jgi:tRNA-binding EMAP/Myf-like protein